MWLILFVLLDGSQKHDNKRVDYVDRIELNHVMDEDMQTERMGQFIFWDFSPGTGEYRVVDWKRAELKHVIHRQGNQHILLLHIHAEPLRIIYARSFIETWTDYDPEIIDTEILPRDQRRGLSK